MAREQKMIGALPQGGGEMGERIRAFDWASHPLGAPETWPPALHVALGICLNSSFPTAIYWGPDLHVLYNDAWSHIPAERHPWALGRAGREVWPDIWDVVGPQFAAVIANAEGFSTADQLLPMEREGKARETYWDYSITPIMDETGNVSGVFNQGRETTELVMAARAREAQTERLREIFAQAPGAICVLHGPNHVFEIANGAYLELVGRGPDIVGLPVAEALPEVVAQGFTALLDKVYRTGEPYRGRNVAVELDRDGRRETRIVDFIYQPMRSAAGAVTGIFTSAADVTERSRAESALRQEKQRLEVINTVGAAIAAELDVDKIVQAIVGTCVDLTGAQFGTFFHNILDEQGAICMRAAVSDAPRSVFETIPMPQATKMFAPTFAGEGVVRSDDLRTDPRYGLREENLPVRSYLAVPVASRSGEVLGGLFFGHKEIGVFKPEHETLLLGISGQAATAIDNARLFKQLETLNATLEQRIADEVAERTRAEDQLRQAQKMEAIGQLTGGIAHDFNNMLAVVIGGLNLTQRRLGRGDMNVTQYLDAAMDGATRASGLTQRLLAFSRQQPLEPRVIDPNKLVASMTELLMRALGEHIQIETVLGSGLWRCFADPLQLESAILNLAVNARDAMPAGGKLTIDTGNAMVDASVARTYAIPEGQYLMIAVSDTGTGMTSAVMEQAFDPFFTTKSVGKGSGLGLSQVFGFIRQSGGHVKIYSEIGIGTTVKLYLPRYTGSELATTASSNGPAAAPGHESEAVLVVEDEERVRAYSVEALKELGYNVLSAPSGSQALKIISENPAIDLLFTDIVMPEMNGRELSDRALKLRPSLKVLFTTGYTRNAVVHNGVLDPGTAFLQKPFTVDQLALKIRSVLDS